MNQPERQAPIGEDLYVIRTGDWRTHWPVKDQARCNECGICALYCPTASVRNAAGSFQIDLTYCKGCGICAWECPKEAIYMLEEGVAAR